MQFVSSLIESLVDSRNLNSSIYEKLKFLLLLFELIMLYIIVGLQNGRNIVLYNKFDIIFLHNKILLKALVFFIKKKTAGIFSSALQYVAKDVCNDPKLTFNNNIVCH